MGAYNFSFLYHFHHIIRLLMYGHHTIRMEKKSLAYRYGKNMGGGIIKLCRSNLVVKNDPLSTFKISDD